MRMALYALAAIVLWRDFIPCLVNDILEQRGGRDRRAAMGETVVGPGRGEMTIAIITAPIGARLFGMGLYVLAFPDERSVAAVGGTERILASFYTLSGGVALMLLAWSVSLRTN